ncbi:MarR family winged helix-turn-helix transcriptional regulator [Terrisporobacter sp.]
MLTEQSKEFLDSISKLRKMAHPNRKKQDFHSNMLMTVKTIYNDYLENKDSKNYYGMKTSDLTKNLCITKSATSKLLNHMEEEGYISRSSNKSDRRIVYVRLTEKGEDFLRQQTNKFEEFTCKVVEKMGEEDINNLIHLFDKLYNVIEELQSEK